MRLPPPLVAVPTMGDWVRLSCGHVYMVTREAGDIDRFPTTAARVTYLRNHPVPCCARSPSFIIWMSRDLVTWLESLD